MLFLDNFISINDSQKYPAGPTTFLLAGFSVNLDMYMAKGFRETGVAFFTCLQCKKEMTRKDHMKNHIQTHFPTQAVSCPKCYKIYKNVPSLSVHINRHHKNDDMASDDFSLL